MRRTDGMCPRCAPSGVLAPRAPGYAYCMRFCAARAVALRARAKLPGYVPREQRLPDREQGCNCGDDACRGLSCDVVRAC